MYYLVSQAPIQSKLRVWPNFDTFNVPLVGSSSLSAASRLPPLFLASERLARQHGRGCSPFREWPLESELRL